MTKERKREKRDIVHKSRTLPGDSTGYRVLLFACRKSGWLQVATFEKVRQLFHLRLLNIRPVSMICFFLYSYLVLVELTYRETLVLSGDLLRVAANASTCKSSRVRVLHMYVNVTCISKLHTFLKLLGSTYNVNIVNFAIEITTKDCYSDQIFFKLAFAIIVHTNKNALHRY